MKIGEVELRMVASPASTLRSAHAMSVNGSTLFRQACTTKRRHTAGSVGSFTPRMRSTASSSRPAMSVRAAISVTGGIVATPILMKVYEAPQQVASSASSAHSNARLACA